MPLRRRTSRNASSASPNSVTPRASQQGGVPATRLRTPPFAVSARPCTRASESWLLLLHGDQQAVSGGQHGGSETVVVADGLADLAQHHGGGFPGGRVRDPVLVEGVVDDQQPAGFEQPHGLFDVTGVVRFVRVNEDEIIGAVRKPRQDIPGPARNGAGAVGGAAGLLERFARCLEVFDVDVDSGPGRMRTPDTPAPVPISTAVCALDAAASTVSTAPTPGPIGVTPSSKDRSRACNRTSSSAGRSSA